MATPEGMHPEVYQKLLRDYALSLPEKIRSMQELLRRLELDFNLEDLTNLRFIVHKTAGNGAIFGYKKLSEICLPWDGKLSKMISEFSGNRPAASFFTDFALFIKEFESATLKN